MGRGQWTHWRRGHAQGWTLELGPIVRLGVTWNRSYKHWDGSLNGATLGTFGDAEAAKAAVVSLAAERLEASLSAVEAFRCR